MVAQVQLNRMGAGYLTIEGMNDVIEHEVYENTSKRYNSFQVHFEEEIELEELQGLYHHLQTYFRDNNHTYCAD